LVAIPRASKKALGFLLAKRKKNDDQKQRFILRNSIRLKERTA